MPIRKTDKGEQESLTKEALMELIDEVLEEDEKRDYKKEAKRLRRTDPKAREKHAARNKARRNCKTCHKGDGKDVHHPGGYGDDAPTQVISRSENRGKKGEGNRKTGPRK